MLRLRPRWGTHDCDHNEQVLDWKTLTNCSGRFSSVLEPKKPANFYSNSYHLAHRSFRSNSGKSSKMFASWDLHLQNIWDSNLGSCTRQMIRHSENTYFYRVLMKGGRARVFGETGTPQKTGLSASQRDFVQKTNATTNYKQLWWHIYQLCHWNSSYGFHQKICLRMNFKTTAYSHPDNKFQLQAHAVSWSSGTSMSLQKHPISSCTCRWTKSWITSSKGLQFPSKCQDKLPEAWAFS